MNMVVYKYDPADWNGDLLAKLCKFIRETLGQKAGAAFAFDVIESGWADFYCVQKAALKQGVVLEKIPQAKHKYEPGDILEAKSREDGTSYIIIMCIVEDHREYEFTRIRRSSSDPKKFQLFVDGNDEYATDRRKFSDLEKYALIGRFKKYRNGIKLEHPIGR